MKEIEKAMVADVLTHIYIGLRKAGMGDENLATKPSYLEGIEEYMYVRPLTPDGQMFQVRGKELLEMGISPEDVWNQALINTCAEAKIKPLAQILGEMDPSMPVLEEDEVPTYVVTNHNMCLGASAILDRDQICRLGSKLEIQAFWILPSSIHEVLLLPDYGDFNLDDLSTMVKEINASEVRPYERLTDRAYLVTMEELAKKHNAAPAFTGAANQMEEKGDGQRDHQKQYRRNA